MIHVGQSPFGQAWFGCTTDRLASCEWCRVYSEVISGTPAALHPSLDDQWFMVQEHVKRCEVCAALMVAARLSK